MLSSETTVTIRPSAMHAMLAAWMLIGVAASSDPWPAAASTVDEQADSYTTAYLNVTSFDVSTGDVVQSEKSEIGKFGEYHVGAATGVLLHVVGTDGDRNGCAEPVHSIQEMPTTGSWIALVRRGKCSFQQKVENARRAGASAVIVYNDREATDLDKMKLQPSDPSEYTTLFTDVYFVPIEQRFSNFFLFIYSRSFEVS